MTNREAMRHSCRALRSSNNTPLMTAISLKKPSTGPCDKSGNGIATCLRWLWSARTTCRKWNQKRRAGWRTMLCGSYMRSMPLEWRDEELEWTTASGGGVCEFSSLGRCSHVRFLHVSWFSLVVLAIHAFGDLDIPQMHMQITHRRFQWLPFLLPHLRRFLWIYIKSMNATRIRVWYRQCIFCCLFFCT